MAASGATGLRPLSGGRKLRLAAEVVAAYVPARARLRREEDVRALVAAARRERGAATAELADERAAALVAERLGRAVTGVLRLLPTDSRCLVSSLVLTRLLARRGLDSTLVIAVRTEPTFGAHAWVEHAGRPVLPPSGPGDRRLVEL